LFLSGPVDQSRIAAQVVSGIGFLGAGLMMREGLNVRGLSVVRRSDWDAVRFGVPIPGSHRGRSGYNYSLDAVTSRQKLNKQPYTDAELSFALRIVCRGHEEQQIRKVLVQEIIQESLLLQSIESEDISGTDKVEVMALVMTNGR
jgi:putative Mg2+ transporter-C (MgtC) family protein